MDRTRTSPAISFQQVGDTGPKVLLCMGYGMRGEVWKPQIDGLSRSCQVVFYDNRGVGKSDAVGDSLSMLDMAKDASRVLDEVGWHEEVHLVGVSMGGMVSQELILMQPARFTSLTLMATHAGGPTALVPRLKGIARFLAVRLGPAEKRSMALARLLYPDSYLAECDDEALRERMSLQMKKDPPRATIRRQLGAIRKHDTRARLAQIKVPTLIVKPELDILVRPSHSDRLRRSIGNASMLSLPDAGHGLIYQSAREINERLLEHFAAA